MKSAACARCGHPAEEHRAEVLPFAVCRHVESREFPDLAWRWAGSALPCPCTGFEEARRVAA